MSSSTLIITNGDSAVDAIKEAEINAEFLPWSDILHDGPVISKPTLEETSQIRAEFLAELGWTSLENAKKTFDKRDKQLSNLEKYAEIILWFEHDLYDQLQLIQILDWLSKNEIDQNIYLICEDQYIGESSPELLNKNYLLKTELSAEIINLGSQIWSVFSGDNPKELEKVLEKRNSELPFLNSAFNRLLQEFPDELNGLSRSENQILSIVEENGKTPFEIFKTFLTLENPKYHGDWTVYQYIHSLCNSEHPLLKYSNGTKQFPPENDKKYFEEIIELTPKGREVLCGRKNNLAVNGINRWIGGIHLSNNNVWIRKNSDGKLIKLIM